MEKVSLIYLAGLFDGDGCICIGKHKNVNCISGYQYALSASISTSNKTIPYLFKSRFGGFVSKTKEKNKKLKYYLYRWEISSIQAYTFIEKILPHLIEKKEQAKLGMEFQEIKSNGKMGLKKTKEELKKEQQMYSLMRKLKNTHKVYINAPITKEEIYRKTSLKYLSGIFDAEGCILIVKAKNKDNLSGYRYFLRISLEMANKIIPTIFQHRFGSSICKRKSRSNNRKHYMYTWQSLSNQSLEFLKLVLPFLIQKKEEAMLGIKFQEMKKIKPYRWNPKTVEELEREEGMYLLMRELKNSSKTCLYSYKI